MRTCYVPVRSLLEAGDIKVIKNKYGPCNHAPYSGEVGCYLDKTSSKVKVQLWNAMKEGTWCFEQVTRSVSEF